MSARRWLGLIPCGIALLLLLAWVGRAWLAGQIARAYFRAHGISSRVEIGSLGLAGITGRFALGPPGAPDVSARRIEVRFDPVHWMPTIVEVRLVDPVVRARIGEDGRIALGSLQHWLDSLPQGGKSDYVSENLAIAVTGLSLHLATPAGALEIDGDVKLVKNLPAGTESLNGEWIGRFLGQLGEVIDRTQRTLFKSLGGLLAAQEGIADQWVARGTGSGGEGAT